MKLSRTPVRFRTPPLHFRFSSPPSNLDGCDDGIHNRKMTKDEFYQLFLIWSNDSRIQFSSNTEVYYENPAFCAAIDAGFITIPWVFEFWKDNDDWGFPMILSKVTNANPIKEAHFGKYDSIKQDWFDWAAVNGHA